MGSRSISSEPASSRASDPSFRDALDALGIPESSAQTLDQRDYVKVAFASEADAQEESLWQALNLIPWNNMA